MAIVDLWHREKEARIQEKTLSPVATSVLLAIWGDLR
jgi:hypothetical protein